MEVDFIVPNLEVSGTVKYLGGLASGFIELGYQIRLLYAGIRPNFSLIDLPCSRFKWQVGRSRLRGVREGPPAPH